ncbi:MAG: cytochrome c [Chlorobiaceae bacterium]|nr:cytochrome c [Chlorobiaceae bacterium]
MQKKTHIRKTALLAALSVFAITGCGKKPGKNDKAGQAAADSVAVAAREASMPFTLKEGKRLYNHYCFECHGDAGDGSGQYYGVSLTPQPANFTDKAFMKSLTDEKITKVISEGSASVGKSNMCPPWGRTLDKEEIECLVEYVKTFVPK